MKTLARILTGIMMLALLTAPAMAEEALSLKVGMPGGSIKAAMVVLASEMGYYEEEGLKVSVEAIPNLNEGLTAVEMGKIDILPLGVIPSMTFISQGAELMVYGGTIAEGSQAVVKAENQGMIEQLTDFRGKKVGCVRPETGHMIMKGLMREAGVDVKAEVEFVELDGFQSVIEAVNKGAVDIGIVNSGFGLNAVAQGLVIEFDVGDYAPDAVCCRQTTTKKVAQEKREALVKFQIANLRAMKLAQDDPAKTVEVLTRYSGQSEEYVTACIYDGVMKISMDPAKKRVEEFYEIMKRNGDIDPSTPYQVADCVDSSIYLDALNEMIARYPEDALFEKLAAEYALNN